jgi:hypothetical protein
MGWGVNQEVECLICKHKALSSKSSPTKKEKDGANHQRLGDNC